MLDFQERVLSGIGKIPFQEMAKAGIDSDEIKKQIITILNPFFENENLLNDFALDSLPPEADNCMLLKQNPNSFALFKNVLEIYRDAKKTNPEACYEACAAMEFEVSEGLKIYWSTVHAEASKDDLGLSDFAFESFRQIGTIIEACIQPILKELRFILKVSRNKEFDFTKGVEFGGIVDELKSSDKLSRHLTFTKDDILLNQVRNIAQHLNFQIQQNMINVSYKNGEKKASLSRGELDNLLEDILSTFNAVRLARVIFNVDNILGISNYINTRREHRDDQILFSIISGLMAKGYQCSSLVTQSEYIQIELIEQQTPTRKRALAAMHYLSNVWKYSQKDRLKFSYLDKAGAYLVESILDKESGLKLINKEISVEDLFRNLSIKETHTKISIFTRVFNWLKSIWS